MGTIPTPPTITAGQMIPAATFNQYRDATNFWATPPQCFCYRNAGTSFANATVTTVSLDAEVYDIVQAGDTPMHDLVTNTSKIFIRTTGKYQIRGQIAYSPNASGARGLQVVLNGGSPVAYQVLPASPVTDNTVIAAGQDSYPLNAGDYLELAGSQSSGGSLSLAVGSAYATFLSVKLVSA